MSISIPAGSSTATGSEQFSSTPLLPAPASVLSDSQAPTAPMHVESGALSLSSSASASSLEPAVPPMVYYAIFFPGPFPPAPVPISANHAYTASQTPSGSNVPVPHNPPTFPILRHMHDSTPPSLLDPTSSSASQCSPVPEESLESEEQEEDIAPVFSYSSSSSSSSSSSMQMGKPAFSLSNPLPKAARAAAAPIPFSSSSSSSSSYMSQSLKRKQMESHLSSLKEDTEPPKKKRSRSTELLFAKSSFPPGSEKEEQLTLFTEKSKAPLIHEHPSERFQRDGVCLPAGFCLKSVYVQGKKEQVVFLQEDQAPIPAGQLISFFPGKLTLATRSELVADSPSGYWDLSVDGDDPDDEASLPAIQYAVDNDPFTTKVGTASRGKGNLSYEVVKTEIENRKSLQVAYRSTTPILPGDPLVLEGNIESPTEDVQYYKRNTIPDFPVGADEIDEKESCPNAEDPVAFFDSFKSLDSTALFPVSEAFPLVPAEKLSKERIFFDYSLAKDPIQLIRKTVLTLFEKTCIDFETNKGPLSREKFLIGFHNECLQFLKENRSVKSNLNYALEFKKCFQQIVQVARSKNDDVIGRVKANEPMQSARPGANKKTYHKIRAYFHRYPEKRQNVRNLLDSIYVRKPDWSSFISKLFDLLGNDINDINEFNNISYYIKNSPKHSRETERFVEFSCIPGHEIFTREFTFDKYQKRKNKLTVSPFSGSLSAASLDLSPTPNEPAARASAPSFSSSSSRQSLTPHLRKPRKPTSSLSSQALLPPRPKARVDSISQQPVPLEGLTCALLANSLTLKNDQEELRDLIEKNPELVADATDFMETPNPGVFLRIDPKTQEQTTCRMLKIDPATCVPEQLEIRKLPELGHGVFAKENLAARTYLAPYFGTTRLEKPGHPDRSTKYMWDVLVYNVGSDKDSNGRSNQTALVIDADPAGNYTRLINSSESSPNLDFEVMALTHLDGTVSYQIVYKVKKPIRTGEQLLISYGKDYWKGLTDENGQSITPKQINPKTFLVIDGQVCKWNFKQQTYDPVVLNM